MFDITVGLFSGSDTVDIAKTGEDSNGKMLFTSQSMMMREKINIYRQYAKLLLGDADSVFASPFGSTSDSDKMGEAMFLNFKRLFVRDGIRRETFAMKFYQTGVMNERGGLSGEANGNQFTNLNRTSTSGSTIFSDVGSNATLVNNQLGSKFGTIVDSNNTNRKVGLLFYKQGIAVFNLAKIISGSQHVSGTIAGMRAGVGPAGIPAGKVGIGTVQEGGADAKFIPDLMISGSIDDIVDHLASCRFDTGNVVVGTFQNETVINSTLFFCRAGPDEFNFSSNPTYLDAEGRMRVIETGQETTQKPFAFVTTIALHNSKDEVMAVAKLSRPVEKNEEKDITFRVRLDF